MNKIQEFLLGAVLSPFILIMWQLERIRDNIQKIDDKYHKEDKKNGYENV